MALVIGLPCEGPKSSELVREPAPPFFFENLEVAAEKADPPIDLGVIEMQLGLSGNLGGRHEAPVLTKSSVDRIVFDDRIELTALRRTVECSSDGKSQGLSNRWGKALPIWR